MINELMIKNFQSHKFTDLKFVPGINVIIGPSDSGKSAVIRAIQWLIYNRPLGDGFRSRWGGEVIVRLETERGYVLHSRSENGNNEYVVNEVVLKAFGTDVPGQVNKIIRLDETNLQKQFDAPFLLSQSPGEVARHYNKIANLEQIDLGLKNVTRWINQINSEIKYKQDDLDRLEFELKKFEFLDRLESELEVLEQLETRINKTRNELYQLESFIQELSLVENKVGKLSVYLEVDKDLERPIQIKNELDGLLTRYESLEELVDTFSGLQDFIKESEDFVELEDLVDQLLFMYEQERNLSSFISEVKDVEMQYSYREGELKALEDTFYSEMPDICPLCGQRIQN